MKICHITSAHPQNDARILEKQCVSLAKNTDDEVFLVAIGESRTYKGVNVVGIGDIPQTRLNRILNIRNKVIEKAESIDADVYELHDPELLGFARRLHKKRKKVIFDSHEDYRSQIKEKAYIPKLLRNLVSFFYAKYEDKACRYLDAVLYPEEKSPYEGKVRVCVPIYNSPILDEFQIKTPFSAKNHTVCCIGSLTEARGITNLVEACHLAGVKLILGGAFSPSVYGEQLKASPAFECVDYRGVCDRKEVIEIYNESLIGADTILPIGQYPKTKNLSTKVYEYMAMKMPYITSNFEYNVSIIEKYKTGLYVDSSNVESIKEGIEKIIYDKNAAMEMGENGYNFVNEHFSWNKDEERLYKLYASFR